MITSLNRQQEYEFPGILAVISKQLYTHIHTQITILGFKMGCKIIARLIFCSRKDTQKLFVGLKHFDVCTKVFKRYEWEKKEVYLAGKYK